MVPEITPSGVDPAASPNLDSNSTDNPLAPAGTGGLVPRNLTLRAVPVFCCDPLEVEFTVDTDDPMLNNASVFTWDFGDGRTATGRTIQHRYPWKGDYDVVLSAQLPDGSVITSTHQLTLTVDESGRSGVIVRPDKGGESPGNGPIGPLVPAEPSFLTADAGDDFESGMGSNVTLTGRVTGTAIAGALTFDWVQVGGPSISLLNANHSTTTFTTPDDLLIPTSFTFKLTVTSGSKFATDQVVVHVIPDLVPAVTETAPIVQPASVTWASGEPVELTLSGLDPLGADLSFSILTQPVYGQLGVLDNTDPRYATVIYTPPADFVGNDVFTFRASAGSRVSRAANFTIIVVNPSNPITLLDAAYLVPVNRSVKLYFSAYSRTPNPLSFEIIDAPQSGFLSPLQSSSSLAAYAVYTPSPDFSGTDTFTIRVADGLELSDVATITLEVQPLIIPWIEINNPVDPALNIVTAAEGGLPGMTNLDYAVAGLNYWSKITDTVIVSTVPKNGRHVYPWLMQNIQPHVRVIGGLKTYILPGARNGDSRPYDYTNAAVWKELSDEAKEIVQATGFNKVLWENETALTPYHQLEPGATIDYRKFATTLQPLRDSGIEFWWYFPTILADSDVFPDRLAHTTVFVRAIKDNCPGAVFVAGSTSWYDWKSNRRQAVERRNLMSALVGPTKTRDPLLVRPDGYMISDGVRVRCYTPTEAITEIRALTIPNAPSEEDEMAVPEVIFYPGVNGWFNVGEELSRILPPLAEIVDD